MKLILICLLVVGMFGKEFDMPVKKGSPDEKFMKDMMKNNSLGLFVIVELYKANCYKDYNSIIKFHKKLKIEKPMYIDFLIDLVADIQINPKNKIYNLKKLNIIINSYGAVNCNDKSKAIFALKTLDEFNKKDR